MDYAYVCYDASCRGECTDPKCALRLKGTEMDESYICYDTNCNGCPDPECQKRKWREMERSGQLKIDVRKHAAEMRAARMLGLEHKETPIKKVRRKKAEITGKPPRKYIWDDDRRRVKLNPAWISQADPGVDVLARDRVRNTNEVIAEAIAGTKWSGIVQKERLAQNPLPYRGCNCGGGCSVCCGFK